MDEEIGNFTRVVKTVKKKKYTYNLTIQYLNL